MRKTGFKHSTYTLITWESREEITLDTDWYDEIPVINISVCSNLNDFSQVQMSLEEAKTIIDKLNTMVKSFEGYH